MIDFIVIGTFLIGAATVIIFLVEGAVWLGRSYKITRKEKNNDCY